MENVLDGHSGLRELTKSVLYYLQRASEEWEDWLPAVADAFDKLSNEDMA